MAERLFAWVDVSKFNSLMDDLETCMQTTCVEDRDRSARKVKAVRNVVALGSNLQLPAEWQKTFVGNSYLVAHVDLTTEGALEFSSALDEWAKGGYEFAGSIPISTRFDSRKGTDVTESAWIVFRKQQDFGTGVVTVQIDANRDALAAEQSFFMQRLRNRRD